MNSQNIRGIKSVFFLNGNDDVNRMKHFSNVEGLCGETEIVEFVFFFEKMFSG